MNQRRKASLWITIGLSLILACSFFAFLFNTSVGKVRITEVYYETEYGTLSGSIFKPTAALSTATVPAIVLAHDYGGNREQMNMLAIELSKRGYVVFALDLYGHGHSTLKQELEDGNAFELVDYNAAGLWDGVRYLFNLNYVNTTKIAIAGFSSENFNNVSKVLEYDNAQIDNGGTRKIAAVCFLGTEPADYSIDALRGRDAAVIIGNNDRLFEGVGEYLASVDAHQFVNQIASDANIVAADEAVRNGAENLRTPGYAATKVASTATETFATGGMAVGAVVTTPAGLITDATPVKDLNPGMEIIYSWKRTTGTGQTAITNTAANYTLVAADIAVGVTVSVTVEVKYPGTYRAIYIVPTGHANTVKSFSGASAVINYFGNATQAYPRNYLATSGTSELGQSWWVKEAMTGLALAGFFIFILGVAKGLLGTSFFASVKTKEVLNAEAGIATVNLNPVNETHNQKYNLFYWAAFGLLVIASAVLFVAMQYAFGGVTATVFSSLFSQPVTTYLMVTSLIIAIASVGLFMPVILMKLNAKNVSVKKLGSALRAWGIADGVVNVLKALLLVFIAILSGIIMLFFMQWMWHIDFRFGSLAAATFEKTQILQMLVYALFFAISFFLQSFVINHAVADKKHEILNYLLCIAVSAGGLLLVGLFFYVQVWSFVWLSALSAVFARLFYKSTGKLWAGVFFNAILFAVILCSGTITLR